MQLQKSLNFDVRYGAVKVCQQMRVGEDKPKLEEFILWQLSQ